MSHLLRRPKAHRRAASVLLAGIVSVAALPGCDTAPQTGSVNMGGKEGRAKITPGAPTPPAESGAATPAKPKVKGPPSHNIKERPGGAG